MNSVHCVLTLFLGVQLTSCQYPDWQPGKTYTYGIQLEVSVESRNNQMNYQIQVTRTGRNTVLLNPKGPIPLSPELSEFKAKEYFDSPIELNLEHGILKSIKIDGHLPKWAENFKKEQAFYFVTLPSLTTDSNLHGTKYIRQPELESDEDKLETGGCKIFNRKENTIYGECWTEYKLINYGLIINQKEESYVPGVWRAMSKYCDRADHIYEINKSIQSELCQNSNGTYRGNLVSSYTVCWKCGQPFTILRIEQENQIYNNYNRIEKDDIKLVSVKRAKRIGAVTNPRIIFDLSYAPEESMSLKNIIPQK